MDHHCEYSIPFYRPGSAADNLFLRFHYTVVDSGVQTEALLTNHDNYMMHSLSPSLPLSAPTLVYQCLVTTSHPFSLTALNNTATFFLFMPSRGATSSIARRPSRCLNSIGQLSLNSLPVVPKTPS
jgi:hypothetical protein